jgi:hypothetical protein
MRLGIVVALDPRDSRRFRNQSAVAVSYNSGALLAKEVELSWQSDVIMSEQRS